MAEKYDIVDFQREVIEESQNIPVLVDFWAEWCQPCKMLGPVLEKVAEENVGRFKLAKLNTEQFQETARQYGISSIPAVKLFINGEVKQEFVGALPKNAIEKWLDEHIPSEAQKEFENIKQQIKINGFDKNSQKELETVIHENKDLIEARILLAQQVVLDQPEKALELVKNLMEDSPYFKNAVEIKSIASFLSLDISSLEENPLKEKFLIAQNALKQEDYSSSLEALIHTVMVNKAYQEEIARKVCVALFNILGAEHEVTKKYRRKFDMALY